MSGVFVAPLEVFDTDQIAAVRAYFDDLLERYVREGKDSYSISSAHLRHGRVWDLLTEPRIVDLVSDFLGPNVVGWGSHFFCKMPGERTGGRLASGCVVLAAQSVAGGDGLAGDRRRRHRQRLYEIRRRQSSSRASDVPAQFARRTQRARPDHRRPRAVRHDRRRRTAGRAGVAPLRPALARLRGEHQQPGGGAG